MKPKRPGALHLFTFHGINVFLHWSWIFGAYYLMTMRQGVYSSAIWIAAEVLMLFVIVLLHEFGHVFACRQVGGNANEIVLLPVGGVALVAPPERAGAQLWTIAAGPLVNVALIPVLLFIQSSLGRASIGGSVVNETALFWGNVASINDWLLVLNLLPIYPLDGGQILRSLLWFVVGRARSLQAATMIGFIGAVAGGVYSVFVVRSAWNAIVAFFIFSMCRQGWARAQALLRVEQAPKRPEFECPQCHAHPPEGPFWLCARCRTPFDIFASGAICPQCQAHHAETRCIACGASTPPEDWQNVTISVERLNRPPSLQ